MQLSTNGLKQVQQFLLLTQHHEQILQAIKASLGKVVQDETGVDLNDGDWSLNTDTGVLEHVATV